MQAWADIASNALQANRWLISAAHLPDGKAGPQARYAAKRS
jgi:hypothetical protein